MRLGLILGDQLFPKPVEAEQYMMIESLELCTRYTYHKQKIVFVLSAMRSYAKRFDNISYNELSKEDFITILKKFVKQHDVTEIVMYEIEDKFFEKQITTFCKENNVKLTVKTSPGFLTTRKEFVAWRNTNKLLMAEFYKFQRRKHNILLEGGAPKGGTWSFDEDNRKKLPKKQALPKLPGCDRTRETKEVMKLVEKEFASHPGSLETFWLPTTREQALSWLEAFFNERFAFFGDYEDAIEKNESFIYHSALAPLLNCGLLTPKEIVEEALKKDIPINSKEGFIRQIIGWREFIRGCYHTSNYENLNYFNHKNNLSKSWYTGTTGIEPLDDAIKKVQQHGYLHHIERLMVVGNCMLLSEINPDEVNKWFMELFIDSADWVMQPNVYSMSQFADGGLGRGGFATKPYVASSNYIRKMSHYQKDGWCDVLDGLYWRFIRVHQETFSKNPRMSMMVAMAQDNKHDKKIVLAEEWLKENTL